MAEKRGIKRKMIELILRQGIEVIAFFLVKYHYQRNDKLHNCVMAIAMKSEPSGLNKHYRKNEEIINNVTDGGINLSY